MDLMEILKDDNLLCSLVCLIAVVGFVLVAIIKAIRGTDNDWGQ